MDNVIVWTPSILHFKGLGMRNLQYEMKSHNKVTKTVYVWFEFYGSDVIYALALKRSLIVLIKGDAITA